MRGRTTRSAEGPRIGRPAIDLRVTPLEPEPQVRETSRRKVWEIQGGLQCSIIGTCLSHEDLVAIGRRAGVRPREDARAYEVHSYFVQQVGKDGKIARTVQKVLDQRHAGIIRRVQGVRDEGGLARLWEEEFEAGRVAGAYWAFMSAAHVPSALGTRIFGDVHMLSHVLGRVTHQNASRSSELQARLDDLEAKLLRQAERHRQVAIERDAVRARLSETARSAAPSVAQTGSRERRPDQPPARRERALAVARERARAAERMITDLQRQLERLRWQQRMRTASTVPACPGAEVCDETVRTSIARRILYIGGRSGAIENLRRVASRMGAELVHHDGGEEHALVRIDGMIEGCDAVVCPIDCVSHSACLRAKVLCRKFAKPFLPLRSAGATSFERAVMSLTARAG